MKATERQKQRFKKYYQKNREKLLQRRKDLYYSRREYELAGRRQYFLENKEGCYKRVHDWTKKRIVEIWIDLGNKCCRCGYDNVVALEVHHKDGTKQKERRSRDYTKLGYDLNRIELICANCHKVEHYGKSKINRKD